MAEFSATEAAFTGFRIVRERPRAVLVWAAIQVVVGLAFGVFVATSGAGAALVSLRASPITSQDTARLAILVRQLLPLYGGALLFSLAFYPILFAAMARAVLHPQDARFGYLRLGRDELRQFGLMLWMLLVGFIFYVMTVLVVVVVALVAGIGARGSGGSAAGALVGSVAVVAFFAGWLFIAVRLSLASPLTFATRRVNLFGSWSLTRGRFWPILGAYCLALALSIVVYMLGFAVISAAAVVAGGGMSAVGDLFSPDFGSLHGIFTVARLIQLVLGGALTALIWPVMLAPPSAIYRGLSGAAVPKP